MSIRSRVTIHNHQILRFFSFFLSSPLAPACRRYEAVGSEAVLGTQDIITGSISISLFGVLLQAQRPGIRGFFQQENRGGSKYQACASVVVVDGRNLMNLDERFDVLRPTGPTPYPRFAAAWDPLC